jgi:hypothetical protein
MESSWEKIARGPWYILFVLELHVYASQVLIQKNFKSSEECEKWSEEFLEAFHEHSYKLSDDNLPLVKTIRASCFKMTEATEGSPAEEARKWIDSLQDMMRKGELLKD